LIVNLSRAGTTLYKTLYDDFVSSTNFHTKEIAVKIVYYGPGLCGKTTSLQTIFRTLPEEKRPNLLSLATEVDRTIFFDFLPVTAYRIRDFKVRLQLYTVPGQVFYNATRKLVLNGVDGIIFVADSQREMKDSNLESLQNMEENLAELGLEVEQVPLAIQFNKRDLANIYSVEEMDSLYNRRRVPVFCTVATDGTGLWDALKTLTQMVVNDLIRKGLGAQLKEQQRQAGEFHKDEPEITTPTNMTDAMTQVVRGSLWPAGESAGLGEAVTRALESGLYADVVLAVNELLASEVRRWAVDQSHTPADALATFLYLKGVPPERYRAFLQALVAARAGRPVSQAVAMGVFVLALQALW
jgi:signal recognition particle receptor subunit beta